MNALRMLLCAFVLFAAAAAQAQDNGGPFGARRDSALINMPRQGTGIAQDAPIDPKSYVLGPGDGLVIETLGRAQLTFPSEVDPEGNLWIPDFGSMRVAGLTLDETRTKIKKSFARGLEVSVRLVRMRHIKIYVTGEVNAPGVVETTPATRVSEAIQFAGGLRANASRRNIRVERGNGKSVLADLTRFERTAAYEANPLLIEGDRVVVPPKLLPVSIYAPVPYPGEYEFQKGDRVSSLIAIAGGLLPTAVTDRAMLLRFAGPRTSDSIAVDLSAPPGSAGDLELQEGDRVFVPGVGSYHETERATIVGLVGFPGDYPIREGVDRVSMLIERAGGFMPGAREEEVLLVRRSGTALDRDPEFDRLSRLSRAEMTESEYHTFRGKLASAQNTFLVDLRPDTLRKDSKHDSVAVRDVLLQPGDLVIAERQSYVVRVAGEVLKPGLIEFGPSRRGEDYIALAGGYAERANRGDVRLTRSSTGQTTLLRDIRVIEPGDLIYVPDKKDHDWLATIRDFLTLGIAFATLIVVAKD